MLHGLRFAINRPRLLTLLPLLTALSFLGCNAPTPRTPLQPTDAPRQSRYPERNEDRYSERSEDRYSQRRERNYPGHDGRSGSHQNRRRTNNGRAANNTPGSFDFYLLNLSWAPEYCYSHPHAAECVTHATFVLHGLWPQNDDGSYPANCSDIPAPTDLGRYHGLYPDLGLLGHEWSEHGTCTGLTPEAYLAAAQRAVDQIHIPPALAHLTGSTSMPPTQIVGLFSRSNPGLPPASLALSCGGNFLTAVEVCLDKDLHPAACQAVRSCNANTVRIPAP